MAPKNHVLFVTVPEAGHVLPLVPIARRLTHAEYKVSFVTSPHFIPELSRQGYQALSYAAQSVEDAAAEPLYSCPVPGLALWQKDWARSDSRSDNAMHLLHRLEAIAETNEVDLTVVDALFCRSPIGIIASYRKRHPVLFVSTSLLYSSKHAELNRPDTLVLCPPAILSKTQRERFSQVRYVEPSIDHLRSEIDLQDDSLSLRRPLILCTFGSQAASDLCEVCIRISLLIKVAEALPEFSFVVSCGLPQSAAITLLKSIPANFTFHPISPQLRLLQFADVFITHGGLGSVKESIYMGVPMLVWPLRGDQMFNARRVAAKGLGLSLHNRDAVLEQIVFDVKQLLTRKGFRANLLQFQSLFREWESTPVAANLIQDSFQQRLRSR